MFLTSPGYQQSVRDLLSHQILAWRQVFFFDEDNVGRLCSRYRSLRIQQGHKDIFIHNVSVNSSLRTTAGSLGVNKAIYMYFLV